jgi:hypothetical protein
MSKRKKVSKAALRREAKIRVDLYLDIGRFTHQFSQLEFTIRALLASALKLTDGQFDVVTAPYDFKTLCTVASKILQLRHSSDKNAQQVIEKLFNKCAALNDDRVRMAHGTWSIGPSSASARHVSRQKLEAGYYFENPGDVAKKADIAQDLMRRLIGDLPRP